MVSGKLLLVSRDSAFRTVADQQAFGIDEPNLLESVFVGHAFLLQGHDNQLGDADRCLTQPNLFINFRQAIRWVIVTSPAPWNRKVWSDSFVLVNLNEAKRPATATLAVPWMSSLKVQYLLRYFSRKRKALWFPKSSNCEIQCEVLKWFRRFS